MDSVRAPATVLDADAPAVAAPRTRAQREVDASNGVPKRFSRVRMRCVCVVDGVGFRSVMTVLGYRCGYGTGWWTGALVGPDGL